MKQVVFFVFAAALLLLCGAVAYGLDAVADGKALFDKKCKPCHTDTKNPLAGVGSKLKPEEMRKWILTPKEMKPDTKMPASKGLSDQDVSNLIAYLSTLK